MKINVDIIVMDNRTTLFNSIEKNCNKIKGLINYYHYNINY